MKDTEPMTTPFKTIRPQLELLEDRCVPSCTVTRTGGVITITGDAGSNFVVVNDNGTGTAGQRSISGFTESGRFAFRGRILQVNINVGDGKDHVFYNLTGTLRPGQSRTVTIQMGNGVNQFCHLGLTGNISTTAALIMNVVGGNDREQIQLDATGTVASQALLAVRLDGGGGRDVVNANFAGRVSGTLNLTADGGGFYDSVRGVVRLGSGSNGRVNVRVNGSDGFDFLTLLVRKSNANDQVLGSYVLDGGTGGGRSLRTPLVTPLNVSGDQVVL
jgi:hypothetical protein